MQQRPFILARKRGRRLIRLGLAASLAAGLVFLRVAQTAAQARVAFLSMDAAFVAAGQTFEVPVQLGVNTGVRSAQFDLHFNPAVLRVVQITAGAFLNDFANQHGGTLQVTPGSVDNVAGEVTGFSVALTGAAGQGPVGAGPVAVIRFTALAPGRSDTLLTDIAVKAVGEIAFPTPRVTGGLVWVGGGPNLQVTRLTFQPAGSRVSPGDQFKVIFQVTNLGNGTADPARVTVSAEGAAPGYQVLSLGALPPGRSQDFELEGYQRLAQAAVVQVAVAGGGSRAATYFPVGDTGTTPVDATVGPWLSLTVPPAVVFPSLQLGMNVTATSLNVRANIPYEVDVSAEAATPWHLREWNGRQFGLRQLSAPLAVEGAVHRVTEGMPALLVESGEGAVGKEAGEDYPLTFTQSLHYCDALVPEDETYHLAVTFMVFMRL